MSDKKRIEINTSPDLANMSEGEIMATLRPQKFEEYIGQRRELGNIKVFVQAATTRKEPLCHLLLSGPPGLGKCITASSLILTERGIVPFSSLIPPNMGPDTACDFETHIYGIQGREPTSQIYASGKKPTRQITTRSGFEIEGTHQHPVLVATPQGLAWKPLGSLTCDDFVGIARGSELWGRKISATCVKNDYNFDSSLQFIPAEILESPRTDVVLFLHALFSKQGRIRSDGLDFGSRSRELCYQIQILLANMGIIAHRSVKNVLGDPFWTISLEHDDAKLWATETESNQLSPAKADPAIYWDRVAHIDESEAEVFDFVVPGTHSFVANGIYNHNTTLANICAREMGVQVHVTSGPAIERKGDLAGILTSLGERDVLFIDEIHRLNAVVEENLYPAMEDFQFDIVVGEGPHARTLKLDLPRFTLIGATTQAGLLTNPLRDRFGHVARLEYYSPEELQLIVRRSALLLKTPIEDTAAAEIARRSRGTPRIANRLLARMRDFALVAQQDIVNLDITQRGLEQLGIDKFGFDYMDRKYLETLIDKFNGGPTGIDTIAAAISEHSGTLEEVYEPYLLQQGFIQRTPRGRIASPIAYEHLGRKRPSGGGQTNLF